MLLSLVFIVNISPLLYCTLAASGSTHGTYAILTLTTLTRRAT